MRWIISFLLCVPLTGCANKDKQFRDELALGRCDEALFNLPQRDPMVKLAKTSEQAAGTVLSYAFVGASYTAEVLWDVAGGTVMVVALCGPLLAAAATGGYYSGGHGGSPVLCLPGKISALGAPPLGRKSIKQTQKMRCPDVASLSRSLRGVSACYEARGGPENLTKAQRNLEALKDAKDFYGCLPAEEHALVSEQLLGIQAKRGANP